MIKRLAARGEKRKGRGFGFVSFEDATTQQKALEAMNGKVVDDRELAVKVAIDSVRHLDKVESAAAAAAKDGGAGKQDVEATAETA